MICNHLVILSVVVIVESKSKHLNYNKGRVVKLSVDNQRALLAEGIKFAWFDAE